MFPDIKNSNATSGILFAATRALRHISLSLPEIAINSVTALSTSGGSDQLADADAPFDAAAVVVPVGAEAVAAAVAEVVAAAALELAAAVVSGFSSYLASSFGAGLGFGAGFAF